LTTGGPLLGESEGRFGLKEGVVSQKREGRSGTSEGGSNVGSKKKK